MVIRRIITFVLCLAVCASSVVIGIVNMKASKGAATETADFGTVSGVSDAVEGINLTDNVLTETADGYKLNGNVTITSTTDAAYTELRTALNRTSGDAIVFDGDGKTITTSVPLFDNIANCTIKNLTVDANVTVNDDYLASTEGCAGIISAKAMGTVSFVNVKVDGTLAYSGGYSGADIYIGSFVGNCPKDVSANNSIANCENGVDITVTHTSTTKYSYIGGFFGGATKNTTGSAENSVNSGNITVSVKMITEVAGFFGWGYGTDFTFDACANFGNINVNNNGVKDHIRGSGFVNIGANDSAKNGSGYASFTDCMNLGDIILDLGAKGGRASGFVDGMQRKGSTSAFVRCINAGSIRANSTATLTEQYVAAAAFIAFADQYNINYIDCVNIGAITGPKVGAFQTYVGRVSKADNNYTVAVANALDNAEFLINSVPTAIYEIIEPPSASFAATAKTNKINNAAALIAVVLADAGKALTTYDGFTVTATGNSTFEANVAEDFYNDVAAIAGNDVEFGAIITVEKYVAKIGEFTHDAFDAYLEANKTTNAKLENIECLYMSTGTMTLEADDFANGVNVALKGAYDITYTARAFIVIGEGAYVYSK